MCHVWCEELTIQGGDRQETKSDLQCSWHLDVSICAGREEGVQLTLLGQEGMV